MQRNPTALSAQLTGNQLLQVLATLASPHRLRVLAALADERNYVSRLARDLGISRALLQVHLRKLEAAGLVSADMEISEDGKAMKFYQVRPFALNLSPEVIRVAAQTLDDDREAEAELR
jgi:DNA-binding transcriptional ArsR family regulator